MFVPVSKPFLDEVEINNVTEAITKKDISGLAGTFLPEFEEGFARYCGVKYGAAVNSGTTALHLAVAALGIGKDDEVLVATMTNMATFFAVLYQGAKPIPIDCEPDTLNIDTKLIEAKITSRTKAIIVVHLYGHPVDMDPIMEIAKKHNLFVIEDAAEAHGAKYKGKVVGGIGHIGCFSFYSNKIITTGEGGMVVTDDKELIEKCRLLKNLAFGDKDKFMHQALGFKYQMTNLQAAVGVGQLKKIEKIIERKREIADYYIKHLSGVKDIILPVEKPYAYNVYWMFNILLTGSLSGKRQVLMSKLLEGGVQTREDFVPYNEQEIFLKEGIVEKDSCPVASSLYSDGLYLPSGTDITEEELAFVVDRFIKVIDNLK
ncbi:MAG: perosamine synthetase [Parcubacteria bacterium C7867-006]|nr:MAG: perosamine synthetase [Parcubacteria bacterium C7867-006]